MHLKWFVGLSEDEAASVLDLRGQPCELAGSPLGMQSIAGGVLVGVKPTMRGAGRSSEIYKYPSADDSVFQFDK